MVGNVITMTNAVVACAPVFIPHLEPENHKLICKVIKMMPTKHGDYWVLDKANVYDAYFWGKSAEIAAFVLKQRVKVNLKGYFQCAPMNFRGRYVMKATFMVFKLELLQGVRIEKHPFDYQLLNSDCLFGNARIWTKEHGFNDKSSFSKLH